MKQLSLSVFFVFSVYITRCVSQTLDVFPYDMPGASGYVNASTGANVSGNLVSIGKGKNKGFIVFDAGTIPAGAVITAAEIQMSANSAGTDGGMGLAEFRGIGVNTIYGQTTDKEIQQGPVYADDITWTGIVGTIQGSLSPDGVAALQKKIGTAFCVGLNPPTNTTNYFTVNGYQANSAGFPKPTMHISYTMGNPSKPNADFTVNTRDTFRYSAVNFYDNSGNYPTSWLWEFGDDSVSVLQNPTHAYIDTGYFTVKLTAKNAQGEDVITKQNYIHISSIPPQPIAEFAVGLRNIAEGEEVSFTDLSAGYVTNWEWRFGDNESSSEQNPRHTYAEKGTYSVRLIVSSLFGADTMFKEDFMNVGGEIIEPVADFSFDNSNGLTVYFYDLCKNFPDEWAWNFGDGSTDAVQNPVHTYAGEGTYTVCVDATNPAGTTNACKEVSLVKTEVIEHSLSSSYLKIYPVPANDILYISLGRAIVENECIELYGPMGTMLLRRQILNQNEEIKLEKLPGGLYFINILRNGKRMSCKKLIKA